MFPSVAYPWLHRQLSLNDFDTDAVKCQFSGKLWKLQVFTVRNPLVLAVFLKLVMRGPWGWEENAARHFHSFFFFHISNIFVFHDINDPFDYAAMTVWVHQMLLTQRSLHFVRNCWKDFIKIVGLLCVVWAPRADTACISVLLFRADIRFII